MDIQEAWKNLGYDIEFIVDDIKSKPIESRISELNRYLGIAKRSAKKLMANNHPDIGGKTKDFLIYQESLNVIQSATDECIKSINESIMSRKIINESKAIAFGQLKGMET